MKVILLEDIEKLGKGGDSLEVKAGYARNYLLPKGLVIKETETSRRFYADRRKSVEKKMAAQRAEMESLAKRIEGSPLIVKVQVGEEGKLFGSVTPSEVARLLKEEKGIEIEKRKIMLDEPIRSLGDFDIPVHLSPGVDTIVKLSVVPLETP